MNKVFFSTRLLVTLALSASLIACSSTDDEDDSQRVAELVEINALFTPEVVWDDNVGNGVEDHFSRIKPIVAYGKTFSASRDGDVIAFDSLTGKEVWQADLSDIDDSRSFFANRRSAQLAGGPVAGMDKVFIGSENGDVFALDAATGDLAWQAKIKGEVITSPAIDNGILVVNSASGILKAFNADTGDVLWQIEQDVPALSLRGVSAPVIGSGGVILGTASGTVSVYLVDDGQQGWTAEVGESTGSTELERVIDVDSAPVIFGDKIYSISSRGYLVSIELRSGRILWKRQYSSYRQLTIRGNDIYFTTNEGYVYCVSRLDGLERWVNLDLLNRGVTGPAAIGSYLVVGDYEGYLHWLDQETGNIVARHHVDGSGIHATPTVLDDMIYSQSRDGDIEAIKTP